jgi:hypothetical protein
MADIRVERGGRNLTWLWVTLAAIVLIVAAVLLLDYLGYIDLPFRIGAESVRATGLAQSAPLPLQEA